MSAQSDAERAEAREAEDRDTITAYYELLERLESLIAEYEKRQANQYAEADKMNTDDYDEKRDAEAIRQVGDYYGTRIIELRTTIA